MAILDTFKEKIVAADATIPVDIITEIEQLIQSLLSGCTGGQVKARATRRPRILQLILQVRATEVWDDPVLGNKIAAATMKVLDGSTPEQIDEFKGATIPVPA